MPPALPRCPTPPLALAVLAALGVGAAAPAMAQSSPWYLGVNQSLVHDSNIYRLGSGQSLPRELSKSDTRSSTALVAGIDQPWGRQRVYGSASLRANRHASNQSLDDEAYSLNLGLDWSSVNRLSGSLSASIDRRMAQFNNRVDDNGRLLTAPNTQHSEDLDAKVRLGVVTRLTLEAGLGWRQRSFSAEAFNSDEYRQTSASLGGSYRVGGALTLGAALRLTEARFPRFATLPDGSFQADTLKRRDIDLTAHWQPGGAQDLRLRLSPTRSRYDRNDVLDFSGLTGSVVWGLQPSGKVRLTTTFSRDSGQSAEGVALGQSALLVTDTSRIATALGLRAAYDLTGKVGLVGTLGHIWRDLRQQVSVAGTAAPALEGTDRIRTLSLGARWQATRSIQVSCDLTAESRASSNRQLSLPLNGHTLGCAGQFVLQ